MGGAVYFSIGDAIAGLGIFLLIPQYLKPIYVFRLRVLGIGLRWLYALPGLGFICVVIAAMTPQFPAWVPFLLRASLFWETLGAALYAASYVALAWVYIFPARSSRRSIANYVRAGTNLLAGASEEDRVELAADIVANIRKLIRIADAQSVDKDPAPNRESASVSESFLHILSDPLFCETVVMRVPWDAARILQAFSEEQPSRAVGKAFVLELARHAVMSAGASAAREIETQAFGKMPLAKAAFGDAYLNRQYLPWEGISAVEFETLDVKTMERIHTAAVLTIDAYVAAGFPSQSYNIARLQESFDTISRRIALAKRNGADVGQIAGLLGRSVKHIVEATRRYAASAAAPERSRLYAELDAVRDFSTLDAIAELVVSVMENTAHDFSGFDDPLWPMARDIWDAVLPRFGAQPPGMDALQQRVAIKLTEKIGGTMEGWHSPLPRQALAIIGPYVGRGEAKERTAFKICRDHVYRALKAFPEFFAAHPGEAKRLLPNNVRYEPDACELVHRYSFGGEDRTNLTRLEFPGTLSLAAEHVALLETEKTPAAA